MEQQKNGLEWIVFSVSLVLTLGVLGYLTYEVVRFAGTPPTIRVSLEAAESRAGHFVVPVRAHNVGGEAAEDVQVEVVLRVDGAVAGRANVTFVRLPRSATREGWIVFASDPRRGELRARVLSYTTP